MFDKIQYVVPRNFQMGAVRVIHDYGYATVEAWDTPEGRLFYPLDEDGEMLAPASERKCSAILAARRHVKARA